MHATHARTDDLHTFTDTTSEEHDELAREGKRMAVGVRGSARTGRDEGEERRRQTDDAMIVIDRNKLLTTCLLYTSDAADEP